MQDEMRTVREPPRSAFGILRQVGPGLVIAGGIVGSGELIATTSTGAKAGFSLLWLIVFGCLVKVFVQIEIGRYTLRTGLGTIAAFNTLPGPQMPACIGEGKRGHLLVWACLFLLGSNVFILQSGILTGVGQSMAMALSVTEHGRHYDRLASAQTRWRIATAATAEGEEADAHARYVREWRHQVEVRPRAELLERARQRLAAAGHLRGAMPNESVSAYVDELGGTTSALRLGADYRSSRSIEELLLSIGARPERPPDVLLWSSVAVLATCLLLASGRYALVEYVSVAAVCAFTLVSVANVVLLQLRAEWRFSLQELLGGFALRLPESNEAATLALSAFGIIGVGAGELMQYPYWCVEKGYARFAGRRPVDTVELEPLIRDPSVHERGLQDWARRSSGWMTVLQVDAWCAAFLYTFSTVAFYLLGASVLHRVGLEPRGDEMIRHLAAMYEPVFGERYATLVCVFGSFCVLFSSFFVTFAAMPRMLADVLVAMRLVERKARCVRVLGVVLPPMPLIMILFGVEPRWMVLWGALIQALYLPVMACVALYYYFSRDASAPHSMVWTALLLASSAAVFATGTWALYVKVRQLGGY